MSTVPTPTETEVVRCPHCGSVARQIRYGRNPNGKQKWLCHACQRAYVLNPQAKGYPPELRHRAVQLYVDGMGFRRIARVLGVHHQSVVNWVNAYHQRLTQQHPQPPVPAQAEDVEMDELYTFIGQKGDVPMSART